MSQNTSERSNILLLCLGLDVDRSNISQVTTRILYTIFHPFGPINKIVLFSKNPIIKAFLEFGNQETAQLAMETTHESFIDNYGKARLYYSTLSEVKFSNRFLDYLDCTRENLEVSDYHHMQSSSRNTPSIALTVSKPIDVEPLGTPNIKGRYFDFDTHHATPNVNSWYLGSTLTPGLKSNPFISERSIGLPPSDAISIHTDRSARSR